MSRLWYKLAVPALTLAYFFVVSVLAALPVWLGYRLQKDFHRAWLFPYTLYLVGWGVFVLLAVVQYMLIGSFLPQPQWDQVAAATRPLFAITLAVTLYFLSSFMAQLTGGRLPRPYSVAYWVVWVTAAVALSMAGALAGDRTTEAVSVASSLVAAVLKLGITYGWIAYALFTLRRIEDPLDLRGLRGFVLLLAGGFLAFDLAVRDVAGVETPDLVISAVQVGANYPALMWLRRFLRERALARPADPLPADLKAGLVALGLSARESDVVELLLAGLSHKEIAERLSIAPDTVKKHTYNAHRKLGVQNRVQLSYFVQNRLPPRS